MKTKVLIFIDWYYPAFKGGGPIKSIDLIIKALADQNEFTIITSNKDADGKELNLKSNHLYERDYYRIIYLSSEHENAKQLRKLYHEIQPDIIYYNSLFSLNYTLIPYLLFKGYENIQNILAPRGMLGEGALSIKPIKKKVFLLLSRFLFFKSSLVWHASTPEEKAEIICAYPKAKVHVAQNISGAISSRSINENFKNENQLDIIFISRISEKKNLLFLLKIFKNLKALSNATFRIFGPIEDQSYWKECKTLIDQDQRIDYKGTLNPDEIVKNLQQNHLYVLPSLNENYGHSIVESINSGVPVLISDQTPWKNIKDEGIGNDISLTNEKKWEDSIIRFYQMNMNDYSDCVDACYNYSKRHFFKQEIIDRNRLLFKGKF